MLQNVCLLVINGVNPSTANLPNDFPTFHPLYLSRFTPTRTNHPPSQDGFPHLHNSLIEAWILLFFLDFSYFIKLFLPSYYYYYYYYYNNFCLPNNYLSIPSKNPSPISQLSTSVLKKYESELYKPEKWKNERYEKKKEIHRNIHDGREFKPRSNRPSRGGRLRIEEENPLPLSLSRRGCESDSLSEIVCTCGCLSHPTSGCARLDVSGTGTAIYGAHIRTCTYIYVYMCIYI